MSLFSALQVGVGTMQAAQIGLEVVGQNIANANTPNYSLEQVTYVPGPTVSQGGLLLGSGVQVQGITQQVDTFLNTRVQSAISDSANTSTQASSYQNLEQLVGALGDNDISTQLNSFFSSISSILNQPSSVSTRNLAVLQGTTLTQQLNSLSQGIQQLQSNLNDQVVGMASSINSLVSQIGSLNVQIASLTGGGTSQSTAGGLCDQREAALEQLAGLIDIQSQEQPDGEVNVSTGSTNLVTAGTTQPVDVVLDNNSNTGMATAEINLANTDAPLNPSSGQLRGLLDTRDQVLGGTLDSLNQFTQTLAYEFNKVYSSGQGLTGYQTVTAQSGVTSSTQPLTAAGLPFTPVNGSFQLTVQNTTTGAEQTTSVPVNLTGLSTDTTLQSLADQLNGISGISASIDSNGKLTITAAAGQEFSFSDDTSGALAALGINTFFTGSTAADLGVNPVVAQDPGKFAASQGGVGADTQNATTMANFMNQPLASQSGDTISDMYDQFVSTVTQNSSVAQAQSTASQSFQSTLQAQQTSVSGVNIDEEAVQMLTLQRSYQAAAQYISTLNTLFTALLQI
jgi:flagellar hook-associated protein 1 FlgK